MSEPGILDRIENDLLRARLKKDASSVSVLVFLMSDIEKLASKNDVNITSLIKLEISKLDQAINGTKKADALKYFVAERKLLASYIS